MGDLAGRNCHGHLPGMTIRLWHMGLGIGVLLTLGAAQAQISLSGTSGVGPFTQAQVDAGRGAYNTACGACHGPNLNDGTHRTPLTGVPFMAGWGWRSAGYYLRYVQTRMPYRQPNTLPAETYANIVAYILAANGARPGSEILTADSEARIDAIADGTLHSDIVSGASQAQ